MQAYDIYTLILCLIIFALLTTLAVVIIVIVAKQTLKLIKLGNEDQKIIKEEKKKKKKKLSKTFDYVVTGLLSLIFIFFFCSSMYINCVQNTYFENAPTYKVVKTDSMARRNEKNEYLFDNDLNDQIQAFDLIATYKLPKEKDLKLYDIVVYEVDGVLLVHRIVEIEEPNKNHPNERYFRCQGDSIDRPDRFPVKYSQMKGIYRGERVPFIGSFVLFLQSPAGWLCILLVAVAVISTPILDVKISKAKKERLLIIMASANGTQEVAPSTVSQEDLDQADAQVIENVNEQEQVEAFGIQRKDFRHFKQKLVDSSDVVQDRYEQVVSLISRIDGIRVIEGKKQESFKKGHSSVARLTFRGKTLCILLALNPNEYQNTKYIFTDISEFKSHTLYPMRLKLTSDRQVRWAKELINDIITKNGWTLQEERKPILEMENDVQAQEQPHKFLEHLRGVRHRRSFGQRLRRSTKEIKDRYKTVVAHIKNVQNVREIESDHFRTFRIKNKPIAKITMKGKTLNVYLALNPNDFVDTKYIFQDVSHVKKYALYPMRVKLTSDRQVRWTCELIDKIMQGYLVMEGGVV
ncbi:MAG: hypothetical protein IKB98_04360 [Clostridia bacterium]|nr:hypothetical protein [Clostridia bacterium]